MGENEVLNDLGDIRYALWEVDIPSPTIPEYVEHHEQIQKLIALVDEKMAKYRGKEVIINEQINISNGCRPY